MFLNMAIAQSTFDGLQAGRYEIRKAEQVKGRTTKRAASVGRAVASESSSVEPAVVIAEEPVKTSPAARAADKIEPSISEQVHSLASGDAEQVYEFYREQVHPDDIRNNRVEIEFSPGVANNDSKSNYSFREYKSFFQTLNFGSSIWFTPSVGISGQYVFSFAADVNGDKATNSKVNANYEFIDLSINLRKFFDLSRKANSIEFNLLYADTKMRSPPDSLTRGRISSTGFGLGLKSRFPTSISYAWVLGGSFFPRVQHSEGSTGLQLNSGSSAEAVRFGLDLGGELKLNRESQVIWNLGITTEKNLFSGMPSLPDPDSGATPENVSVTNSLIRFNLGYRWGQ